MEIKRTKFNISLLGESQVGKTSIVSTLKGIEFDENKLPTIGLDTFVDSHIIEGNEYKFKIFDTNGQERYNSISDTTVKLADGFLVVFSVLDKKSFTKIKKWLEIIEDSVNLKSKVVFIVGNKIDSKERQITKEEAEDFAAQKKMKYFETSAKTGAGIKEVFLEIYNDIYNLNKIEDKPINNNIIIKKDSQKSKEGKKCC